MHQYTPAQLMVMSPVAYAKEQNAAVNEQAVREGWQFWTLMPEDAEFYERMGQKSAYDVVRSTVINTISDVFKENYGFRPRGIYDFDIMTLEELDAELARLLAVGSDNEPLEDEAEVIPEATPLTHNPFSVLAGVLK